MKLFVQAQHAYAILKSYKWCLEGHCFETA